MFRCLENVQRDHGPWFLSQPQRLQTNPRRLAGPAGEPLAAPSSARRATSFQLARPPPAASSDLSRARKSWGWQRGLGWSLKALPLDLGSGTSSLLSVSWRGAQPPCLAFPGVWRRNKGVRCPPPAELL